MQVFHVNFNVIWFPLFLPFALVPSLRCSLHNVFDGASVLDTVSDRVESVDDVPGINLPLRKVNGVVKPELKLNDLSVQFLRFKVLFVFEKQSVCALE